MPDLHTLTPHPNTGPHAFIMDLRKDGKVTFVPFSLALSLDVCSFLSRSLSFVTFSLSRRLFLSLSLSRVSVLSLSSLSFSALFLFLFSLSFSLFSLCLLSPNRSTPESDLSPDNYILNPGP